MIKGIIFDFGEVLTSPTSEEEKQQRLVELGALLSLPPNDVWPYLFQGEPAKKWMTGQLDWDGFWTAVLPPRGIDEPDEVANFHLKVWPNDTNINPEMRQLVHQLAPNYKLAVLSNASWTEEELREIIARHDLLTPFDTIISSASVGAVKPDPKIFQVALDRLNLQASECVFTDDLEFYTAEAAKMGFHASTFTTPAAFRTFLESLGVS